MMNNFDDFDTQWQCEDIYLNELLGDMLAGDDEPLGDDGEHLYEYGELRGEDEDRREYDD